MPMTIPNGFAEATYLYTLAGDDEPMSTSVGVKFVDGTTATQLADQLRVPMSAWVGSTWGDDYVFYGVDVVLQDDDVFFEGEWRGSVPGVAATNHPVQNTALLVRKVSGLAGRSNRGRFFFPPGRLAEADVNNIGVIDAVDVGTIQGEIDDLLADTIALPGVEYLCILHAENPPGTPSPLAPTEITSLVLESTVATQRRRLR